MCSLSSFSGASGRWPDRAVVNRTLRSSGFRPCGFHPARKGRTCLSRRRNPFHCPCDPGRVGIVALRRADWGDGNEPDERLCRICAVRGRRIFALGERRMLRLHPLRRRRSRTRFLLGHHQHRSCPRGSGGRGCGARSGRCGVGLAYVLPPMPPMRLNRHRRDGLGASRS